MVDHVNNNEILTNNSIKQQQELLGIEKKSTSKNTYEKTVDFSDKSEISETALKLYEREKDIEKYRKLVLESIDKDLSTSDIIKLIHNDEKYLSDDELADSLLNNKDFMDLLVSE